MDAILPSRAALSEALDLSNDILRNIELTETPLTQIALKASRLARLLNDFDYRQIFEYEASGYPTTPDGVPPSVWKCAQIAGRINQLKLENEIKETAYLESIGELEAKIESARIGIDAARDPNVSITSANPRQFVSAARGNKDERDRHQKNLVLATRRLSSRGAFIHNYVSKKNLELKFSSIAGDAFSRIRELVDAEIGETVPTAVQKFSAIYDNLESDNPEDWSNAVHGCRRVLQDLADALFPATDTPRVVSSGGKSREIKLGPDNYINRLSCFADDRSNSERATAIIGSHLGFLGERLDSLFKAAQKGSHAVISSREEADRCVVYTYMAVGDILKLSKLPPKAA
ncbi:hypothetical protein [Burkholderia sp. LMG 21824]|uniref:AbiTii domain-containing protein n=1 Tax=Burkholderia sp. LMG 21824 TaxID=3158172 RepID=UPI003C30C7F7